MQIAFEKSDLVPLVREVIRTVLDERAEHEAQLGQALTLSEAEAAEALGIKRHVLRDMRLAGKIPAKKIGNSYRYSRAGLMRWLEETTE